MKSKFEYTDKDGVLIKIDLSIISEDQIIEQYNNGIGYLSHRNYFALHHNTLQHINETKTYTVPANIVYKEIKQAYFLADWAIQLNTVANNVKIIIIWSNINKSYDLIENDMKKYGYYLAYHEVILQDNCEFNGLYFEPNYTDDVTNRIKFRGVAIHITPRRNIKSIVSDKVIKPMPSEKTMLHPDRIYLIDGYIDEKYIIDLIQQLNLDNKTKSNYYCKFIIDTKNLPDNIKFYSDPNFEFGVYTYDPIPIKYINYVVEYNVNDKEYYKLIFPVKQIIENSNIENIIVNDFNTLCEYDVSKYKYQRLSEIEFKRSYIKNFYTINNYI